jgi:prevent-host-death family protein
VFVSEFDPNRAGNVAEAAIVLEAARLGIPAFKPLYEHGRADLILEIGSRLLRVQCKSGPRNGDVVVVRCVTNRRGREGYIRTKYTADEIDALAVYCPETADCYLLPAEMIVGRSGFHLRLAPPRNGQRASVHYAADYRLGAIAQLGERLTGSQKVVGSSPTSSTSYPAEASGSHEVGAHEFRNLFGLYIQRAAAGETFLVTRRGKPYARVSPPSDQLQPAVKVSTRREPEAAEVIPLAAAKERAG